MVQAQFGPRITRGVKVLLLINLGIFFIQLVSNFALNQAGIRQYSQFVQFFALWPDLIVERFWAWQLFTYMFLHGDFFHILFNMLALWMFGSDLESEWGMKRFVQYYLLCGFGAGLFIFLIPILLNQATAPTLGASGAIFGILLAYAIYWPDRKLLFMFIFPIKVKYFVLIIGFISLYLTFDQGAAAEISHVGHLGGLITGYLVLISGFARSSANVTAARTFKSTWNPVHRIKMYRQRKRWLKQQKEQFEMLHMEEKVDSLLDKISREGMRSLSASERKFLKLASEKMGDNKKGSSHFNKPGMPH
ncbi:MAG: rhomboid family intramembrane serine protease [Leptospiraceae bacterium]|nr:rhomboid family intramembrane serine protease [Leptospiraceae bacterium]